MNLKYLAYHPSGWFFIGGNMTPEKENKIDELVKLSEAVACYLQRNFHPHTTVVIEVDSIRVEETLAGRVIEYAPN